MNLLVVEDELPIAEPLLYVLRAEGFATRHVTLASDAQREIAAGRPDFIVLDIGLPDMNGLDLLRRLRSQPASADIPVLLLTARAEEIDRILGLELGADDYVTKPFSPREVVARIRAILRRGQPAPPPVAASLDASPWQRDPEARRIRFHGITLDLTRYEHRLLDLLLAHPGRIYLRDEIMRRVWDEAPDTADRTIDAHIKTLRAKLRAIRADDDSIHTHRGIGYSLDIE